MSLVITREQLQAGFVDRWITHPSEPIGTVVRRRYRVLSENPDGTYNVEVVGTIETMMMVRYGLQHSERVTNESLRFRSDERTVR